MAVTDRKNKHQHLSTNKEPEWSSICDNVFDRYLEDDDLFAVGAGRQQRIDSDGFGSLFDSSGPKQQSNGINHTSSIPSCSDVSLIEVAGINAKQPKAKAPGEFWTKKLRGLEQRAAAVEVRQGRLRAARSQPDFLNPCDVPPVPPMPLSPPDQSYTPRRSRSRTVTANGKKTPTQRSVTSSRSVSRGRPRGVMKPPTSGATSTYATLRRSDASPSKMMNPSRYRAGFKDVWAERIEKSPEKYELRLPSSSQTFPDSPPPSARSLQESFTAFRSPMARCPVLELDDQISPLTNTFQYATRLHTPYDSPSLTSRSLAAPSYFEPVPALPTNIHTAQTIPLNDTASLFPEPTSLGPPKAGSFDFGFSSSALEDTWGSLSLTGPAAAPLNPSTFNNQDMFGHLNTQNVPRLQDFGLGIECGPNPVPNYALLQQDALMPNTNYQLPQFSLPHSSYYIPDQLQGFPITPTRLAHALPTTPRRRHYSPSPSPPAVHSRSSHASSSNRAARRRRAKSTNSTSRRAQNADASGFVNYTPEDSTKILNGVAPSGSSKTKAKREKEAADKRRRLSQAALRAVIEAGGNVEELEKAGLILP